MAAGILVGAMLATGVLGEASVAFGADNRVAEPQVASRGDRDIGPPPTKDLSGFRDTYWYVPKQYLLAYQNVPGPSPAVAVSDQTVWHFTKVNRGFLLGCSYRSIDGGGSWTTSSIIGSVAPNNQILFGFYADLVTVGSGTLVTTGGQSYFLMQVSTAPAINGLTHWAYMAKAKRNSRPWKSLPGTGGQSIPSVDSGC